MPVPVFFAFLFLTVIAGTVPVSHSEVEETTLMNPEEVLVDQEEVLVDQEKVLVDQEQAHVNQEEVLEGRKEYIDEKREFEVAENEKASFEFRSPEYLNGDRKIDLSSWTIFGPDGWTMCTIIFPFYNIRKLGSIERCYTMGLTISRNSEWYTSGVVLPPFEFKFAGIWNISQVYEVLTINKPFEPYNGSYITRNYSVNVYGTEFDRKYNNTMYGVRAGEIIVINFDKKNWENSECRLINRKTNETYDLNTREHRFSGKRTGIQRLDGCGFRMQIENKSEGLWSLVEEFQWKRHRTDFQLSINSSVSQEAKGLSVWWLEDFPAKLTLTDLSKIWDTSSPSDYRELERPDGKIFLRSDMSSEYINIDQVTKDDEGNWRIRRLSGDSMVLMEANYSVTVRDLPEVHYDWSMDRNNLTLVVFTRKRYMPTTSVLKNRNGKYLVGTYSEDERYFEGFFSFDGGNISDEESTDEWEFSVNYKHTTLNGLIPGKNVTNIGFPPLAYVWKSIQRMKYVIRGEKIKVKCSTISSLTNCTLTNPDNVTKYFLDENSLITRTKCSGKKGFCGCIVTIKNANDTHSGTWNWMMEFEGGRKVNSFAPISVVDSYLITEIEQPSNGNEGNNFKFNCRPFPTMHYRKIRYCKWFDSKNHQILTGNSTKYKEIVENNICSLELQVSYKEDLDVWKCVAGLDGSSEEEIHATFDLSKISFNVTEDEPKEKLGKRDEFPLETSSMKSQDNETRKLPEVSDITPGILTQKKSKEKLEESPGAFDISTLVMVIGILIPIVSFCLAICYYVYNKMRMMKKEIREAKAVRKLLVEVKQGPLDPGTMLNEQLDYIRYNEDRWEYPWKNLEFYNEIGRGNFGYVVKARAENIKGDGKKTQVAVKRIFSTSLNYVRALVYELKILSSLTEKHPHIVNLLGACTRDVPEKSGGFCVLLEYCRCGNLHDFLEKNKSEFVSQFERIIVGQIDLLAPGQINHSNPEECYLSESGFRVEFDDDGGVKEVYIPYHSYDSHEIAYNDIHPSGYEPRAFSTGDLMLWGFHVASGMEFLSKNKILHGDLAARNVLLTHSRMAKICDFSLARLIPDGYYQNKINEEVPFKYLAIESLKYKKYSTKTDVWSFGIFLWECFSLGKTPYEELFNSQSILNFLLSGMRLDKPIHSTDDLYDIMLLCWKKDAEDRPTFAELVQKIEAVIEERTNADDNENVNE